jgi:hypothetical protein
LNSEGPGSLKAAPVSLCLLDALPDSGGGPVLYQPHGLSIQQAGACEDYQLSRDIGIVIEYFLGCFETMTLARPCICSSQFEKSPLAVKFKV